MKVTSVEIHPVNSSQVVVLSYRDPNRGNPYNVSDITGLDADSIIQKYYGVSSNSNQAFFNQAMINRVIVFQVGLNPVWANQTYSDLRDSIYRAISSSRSGLVEIWFKNDDTVVATLCGWITKLEAPQFVKSPAVTITFETKSNEPMLKAPSPVNVFVGGFDPLNTNVHDSLSTAPHGVDFQVYITDIQPSVTLSDPIDESWSFGVSPLAGFISGDLLCLSSEPKNKQVYLVRDGVTIHLADKITPGSVWPVIFPGDNYFRWDNSELLRWSSITYTPTYWGV